MNWPTSQDYNEAVQDPAMSFTDPALKGGEVVTNALGLPVPRSGNFADVYQFKGADGKQWALKCFTRKVPGLRERYAKIDEHLRKARLPFTVGFQFFEKGVLVRGEWFPLLKMEWVEGFTLNDFVAENLGKPHYLHALIQMWAKLSGRLRDANMAHADLQHGNVLLVPGATPQKLGLKLIDYDGMWVPALAEFHSGEVGHPNFQHPLRLKEKLYNGDVDRFPHLAIAAGLRAALVGGKPLWEKFDNGDNLFFKEADFRNPAAAPVFRALWELNDPVLRTLVGHIALSSRQPLRKTPWLDDVLLQEGGPRLTAEDERQVCDLLGVTTAAPVAARATAPAAIEQEFNVFQFLDEDEGPAPAAAKASGRRVVPKRQPAKKKSNAPLLIGAGALAGLLVVGAVAAVFLLPGKKDRPTEVVQKEKDPDKEEPPIIGGNPTPKVDPKNVRAAADLGSVVTRDDLRLALSDTKWDWGDGILELRADGSAFHAGWSQNPGLKKRWEPLDRRTVLLVVDAGRNNDRYSVLELSEDLSQFTGFDFIVVDHRMAEKRRVGPLGRPDFRPPDGSPTQDGKAELQQHLAGSEWEWDGGRLKLNADGSVAFPVQPGKVAWAARWEPVDRRTAVALIPRGKAHDRLAVFQFSEDVRELSGYDFAGAAKLPARKRLDAGAAPSPSSGAVVAIAPLAGGKDFVFARKNDPTLYMTVNGSGRQARTAGRAGSPLTTLASASDGSKAVTGGADGEVRFWTFPGPRASMGRRLLGYDRIELFQDRYGIDSYDGGVVLRENATGKEEVVPAGKAGPAPAATFARTLAGNEKLARDLGPAVSDETKLFDGALTVQAFAGGVMCHSTAANKSWWGWHGRRRPDPGPGTAPAKPADFVWLDDALPPGAQVDAGEDNRVAWQFIGRTDGPVQSGAKAVKLSSRGLQRSEFREVMPGMRVEAGDVLFTHVYLDPKDPPKEIMIQWLGPVQWHQATWGVNSTEWIDESKVKGKLPETGRWVRLELKVEEADEMKPGVAISGLGLGVFGGTAYWDTIGVSRATPTAPGAPAAADRGLKVHTDQVVACAVSFDGTRAVTVGRDRQLCEWDIAGAKLVRKFEVPEARAIAYLPGGKTVLLGTETGSAGVWDLDAKTRTLDVEASTVPIRAVCVSPRNDLAFTGAENGKIRIWSVPDFKPVHTIETEQQPVSALAVSADGQMLAAAGPDGMVRPFNAKTGTPVGGWGGKLPIHAVAFLPGGRKLVAAWGLEPVTVDTPALPNDGGAPSPPPPSAGPSILTLAQETDAPAGPPQRMGYRPDGKYLWMGRQDSMTVADGATGREVKTFSVGGPVMYAAFGPKTELYVALTGGRFQAWDWEKGERLHDHDPAEAKGPRPFHFWPMPTPNRLLITTNTPELLVWDTAQWKVAERLTPYPTEAVTRVAPYPGGGRFAAVVVGREGQRAVVWDVREKREAFRLEGVEVRTLIHLEVSPGGRWVVGLSREKDDGRVIVWDGRTGMHAHTIPGVRPTSLGGGFSPGGDHYLHSEQVGRRWSVHLPEGKLNDEGRVQRPSLSAADAPAANLLATADVDRKVRVWRFAVDTKPADAAMTPDPSPTPPSAGSSVLKLLATADAPGEVVHRMGYSPDGKYLWLSHQDSMSVVDGATGKVLKSFGADGRNVLSAAFGPGNQIYVVLTPGKLQAWDWQKGERLHEHDSAEQRSPSPSSVWALPTANRIMVATTSPFLLIWDTAKWKEVERLNPYGNEPVYGATPVPGTDRFAAVVGVGAERSRVAIWDVSQRKEVVRLDAPGGRPPFLLEASPNGRWVIGHTRNANDGTLTVWNARTGKVAHTLSGIKPGGFGGGFSQTGDRYLYPDQGGRRLVISLADGKMSDETTGRAPSLRAVGAPTANLVATADFDRKVRIWRFDPDAKVADPKPTPDPSPTPPSAVVKEGFIKDSPDLSGPIVGSGLSADGKKVFALTQTGTIHVLDATTGAESAKIEVTKAKPIHMAVSPKFIHPTSGAAIPDRLHVLDADRHLHTVDADKGTKVRDANLEKYLPQISSASRLVVTPLESHVMIFDPDKDQAYSWASGRWGTASIPTALNRPPFNNATRTVGFSTDGAVGAGYAGGKLLVWRTRGGREIRQFDSVGGVQWIAIAGEAGVVAVSDGTNLRAWKHDTGAEVLNSRNPHGFVSNYFAAATGSGLVTAGSDRSLKVWDLKTGKETARYPLEQLPAGVAVSPDGRTAAVWYESSAKVGLWALPVPKGK